MAAIMVMVIALIALALAALWFRQEPGGGARILALVCVPAGFLLAILAALAAGKPPADAAAIALLGGAVLPLVLLGQMRLIRTLTARR